MAVIGKRLFWISIIILELVVVYLLWKPYRNRFVRPTHRIAMAPRTVRPPEIKTPPVLPSAIKPVAGVRSHGASHNMRHLIVNTALKTPEPLPPKPVLATPLTAFESFWCNISRVESHCDCQDKDVEQSSNLLRP
jgi:hypothetical protein